MENPKRPDRRILRIGDNGSRDARIPRAVIVHNHVALDLIALQRRQGARSGEVNVLDARPARRKREAGNASDVRH